MTNGKCPPLGGVGDISNEGWEISLAGGVSDIYLLILLLI